MLGQWVFGGGNKKAMRKKIITISREFGSGGRAIGKRVADKLGMDFYDKELVERVALETGFDPRYVEEEGEDTSNSSGVVYDFPYGFSSVMRGMSTADFLWLMQREVILQIAGQSGSDEKGPCVIVGRCADYILKDRDDSLHVFIHANQAFRAERIVRLYGGSEKSPEKRLQDKDKKRKAYYEHYAERGWGRSQNYHISLNSGAIGIDKCVDIIVDLAAI
jgi:cytidylate kinase